MDSTCDKLITDNIAPNCGSPIVEGAEQEAVIINRNDIDFAASTKVDANTYSSIVLKSGTKGYKVLQQGSKPFTGTKTELNVADVMNTHTNTVSFVILDAGPKTAALVDALANGSFVMVIRNRYRNETELSANAFQVYGMQTGLYQTEGSAEKYSDDTNSGVAVTLTEMKAPVFAQYLFDTDYDTTLAKYETLIADIA